MVLVICYDRDKNALIIDGNDQKMSLFNDLNMTYRCRIQSRRWKMCH